MPARQARMDVLEAILSGEKDLADRVLEDFAVSSGGDGGRMVNMTPNDANGRAFFTLLSDMVENILNHSDDPAACAKYITTQVRELIGVRMVALLASDPAQGDRLIGICPAKKENEFSRPEMDRFMAGLLTCNTPCMVDSPIRSDGEGLPVNPPGKSFVIPLLAGQEKVGLLLLIDILDEKAPSVILEALTRVSRILALILKNSILYNNMERIVETRTAQLVQSENLFRSLFEQSSVGTALVDLKSRRFIRVNRKFCSSLGYSAQEMLEMDVTDITHPEDLELTNDIFLLLDSGIFDNSYEKRYIHRNGDTVWGNISFSRYCIRNDETEYFVAVFQNVTERKLAEASLETSEKRFLDIAEHAQEWIWELDAEGNFTYASPGIENILGYTPAEVLQKHFSVLSHPEALQSRMDGALSVVAARQPFREYLLQESHKKGRTVWLAASGIPLLDENGIFLGFRGVATDVTEHRRLEEQLRQIQKIECLGQLAGGVAHDFNNILAVMMMHLYLLRNNQSLDSESRAGVAELEIQSRRAAVMTRQLLMFSRRSSLETRAVDLNEVVVNLLKMLGRLLGEQVAIVFEQGAPLPSVEADAAMLEQVILNMAINSRDAMPSGGRITLVTEAVEIDPERAAENPARRVGLFLCLSVADTGCGMDEPTLKQMYDPFFTTKAVGLGTGLGLATVHGIVAQHRGWIEVASQVGQGTTFQVYLPGSTQSIPEMTEPGMLPVPEGRETLLVVEDAPDLRKALVRALRDLGYRVLEAPDGKEAMRIWGEHGGQIDLLLTDQVMPEGMTGLELAEKLRAAKTELKIIISSGYRNETYAGSQSSAAGIVYLPKPFEMTVLAATIRRCLDRLE